MTAAVRIERAAEVSPRPRARITGVVYLLYFLTAVSGELFIRGIIVSGDPAATATNIRAHERLFRLSVAVGLIATALYIAVTVLFYGLFNPVNKLSPCSPLFSASWDALSRLSAASFELPRLSS